MNESTQLSKPTAAALPRTDRTGLERTNGNDVAGPSRLKYDYTEQGSPLRDYWLIVRKHLWLIFGISVVVPTLVAIYMIKQPNQYEAHARIQVDLETANPLLGGMSKNSAVILNNESNDPAYFNTQLQILTGPGLLRKIVKNLDLEHNQSFASRSGSERSLWAQFRGLIGLQAPPAPRPSTDSFTVTSASSTTAQELVEAERVSDYVDTLQASLSVEPVKETRLTVRETRLIDIIYRHTDPQLAAKIVNNIADTFVQQNHDKKADTSITTSTYLEKRIAELQSTIRTKDEELINYGKNHQILSLDANQNTVVERLEGLNKQLLVAENERKLAEAAYRASLQPGAAEALAEGGGVNDSPSASKLTTDAQLKLSELKQKRAQLLVDNTEKWPEVREVDRQISILEKQVSDARSRATGVLTTNLATRYRQALATEESLRKAYDQQRAETVTQNEAAVQYRIIQQEIETNKGILEGLLQRTKENDVVMAGTPNNIRVVDYSIAPKKPFAPRRTLTVIVSLLLAFCCGVGLAFLIEYMDDTVRSTQDIENLIHLPSVAVIPQIGVAKPKKGALAGGNGVGPGGGVLLSGIDRRSPLAEAYRHLRTSILLSTAGRPPVTMLVTSSVPSEGKTTTAVNTALSLAQTGARVLIVDADMRRPRLHSIFNLSNNNGLSSLLSRDVAYEEVAKAIQEDEKSGLLVLTSGPVPPNPAELLGSDQMLKLISMVTPNFTHVVFDSPPIAAFTDGVLIGAMVDGVLLVVHSGKSSRKLVNRARKLLEEVGARIIGVVLNKADATSHGDYYYNSYYTHYGTQPQPDHQSLSA